jgi:hypothetical protein
MMAEGIWVYSFLLARVPQPQTSGPAPRARRLPRRRRAAAGPPRLRSYAARLRPSRHHRPLLPVASDPRRENIYRGLALASAPRPAAHRLLLLGARQHRAAPAHRGRIRGASAQRA